MRGQQGEIAGEDSGRGAKVIRGALPVVTAVKVRERLVSGGATAPDVGIVQHIVVKQRRGLKELHSRADADGGVRALAAVGVVRRGDELRTQPLASTGGGCDLVENLLRGRAGRGDGRSGSGKGRGYPRVYGKRALFEHWVHESTLGRVRAQA